MAMKRYTILPRVSEMEPYHKIQFSVVEVTALTCRINNDNNNTYRLSGLS